MLCRIRNVNRVTLVHTSQGHDKEPGPRASLGAKLLWCCAGAVSCEIVAAMPPRRSSILKDVVLAGPRPRAAWAESSSSRRGTLMGRETSDVTVHHSSISSIRVTSGLLVVHISATSIGQEWRMLDDKAYHGCDITTTSSFVSETTKKLLPLYQRYRCRRKAGKDQGARSLASTGTRVEGV